MSLNRRTNTRERFVRVGTLVLCCTLVLTVSFFGVVALVTGRTPNVMDRLPFYVVGMATAFVAGIVLFEEHRADGQVVIVGAAAVGVTSFFLLSLGVEGLLYAARSPSRVLTSQLFPYVIAAGMIATGLGFWAVRHWREVAGNQLRL